MFKETKEGQTHYCEACEYETRQTEKPLIHTCGKKVDFFNQPLASPEQLEKEECKCNTTLCVCYGFSKLRCGCKIHDKITSTPTTKPEKWEMGA